MSRERSHFNISNAARQAAELISWEMYFHFAVSCFWFDKTALNQTLMRSIPAAFLFPAVCMSICLHFLQEKAAICCYKLFFFESWCKNMT